MKLQDSSTVSNFYSLENVVNYSGSKTGILVGLDEFRCIIYIYANILFIENKKIACRMTELDNLFITSFTIWKLLASLIH